MNVDERMTALERRVRDLEALEGIRDTVARYSWAFDTKDWADIGVIFTDDAVIESVWRNKKYVGKAAILSFVKQHRTTFTYTNRMSNLNERVTVRGDVGQARSYALVMQTSQRQSLIGWGIYEFDLRYENDMWRIARAVIRLAVMTTPERGWGMETGRIMEPPPLVQTK